METQLPDRLSALEQENAMLRSRLQACEQSHALLQAEVAEYRRREQDRQAQTEPEPIGELTTLSDSLEYRLLEATAIAANTLLTIEDFDQSVNTALKILGESLETDRINVIEFFDHSSDPLPHWRMLYEWHSPNTPSQIAHSELAQGTHQGLEEAYHQLIQGQGFSYLLDEMPEPFRSGQAALGVKALHVVPIFVEDKLWGIVGFDDCCEAKRRSLAELAVLQIAANCLGSAIQRERTQQALLQTEQLRSQELEHLNTELQQTLDRLTESEQRYRQLMELASEGIFRVEYTEPIPVDLPVEEQVKKIYQHFRIAEHNLAYAQMFGYDTSDAMLNTRLSDLHIADAPENAVQMEQFVRNGHQMRNQETVEFDRFGHKRHFFNNGFSIIRDGYAIGAWGTQIDITELRETQEALLQAEQARVAELAEANAELQQRKHEVQRSYRLLSTVAQVTKDLLENPDVEDAIAHALRQIGEAAGISRIILILEKQCDRNGQLHHQVISEWAAPNIPKQMDDPATAVMDNDEYKFLTDELYAGRSVWYVLENFPEPSRTQQAGIGVKSTGAVPIFIEGTYFGCVAFDDCVTYRQWTPHEIDVLTSGAGAIGAALHRKQLVDRLIEERIFAEQERAAELAKANEALQQTVDVLATETDLDRFLGHVLQVIATQLDAPLTEYWYHPEPDNIAYVGLTYWQGQILRPEEQPGHVGRSGYPVPPEMIHQESLHHRRDHFITENIATSVPHIKIANEYGLDAGAWYESHGVNHLLNVPLILGDKTIGALIVFLPSDRHFTEQQIELTYALAQQVTLAIQLTRLAEEAKQAAIDREQEKAAQERATELAKANDALQSTIDAMAEIDDLDEFVPAVLQIVAQTFQTKNCAFYEHSSDDEVVYLRYWLLEDRVLRPEELLTLDGDRFALVRYLAGGFTVPNSYLGTPVRERTKAIVLDHTQSTVPELDIFCCRNEWSLELNVPLVVDGYADGALVVYRSADEQFIPAEIALAESLGRQLALAMQANCLATEGKSKAVEAAIAREQEKAAQERAAELEKANETLQQRDRLLSTVAEIMKDLLENPQVDEAIAMALQRIGEAAGISRIALMQEKTEAETGRLQHCIVHEWTIPGVQRQIEDPRSNTVYNDDYGTLPDELHAGQSIWYVLEDLPEPARTQQGGLAVKSTGAAPIFIEGRYFGCVGFDDCVTYRQWTTYEIDVLVSGAGAIGAALYRQQLVDRLVAERIFAEQERAAELEKANESLQCSLNQLANDRHLESFLGRILQESIRVLQGAEAQIFLYHPDSHTLSPHLGVNQQGQVFAEPGIIPEYLPFSQPVPADLTPAWSRMVTQQQPIHFSLDDPDHWPGAVEWHRNHGYHGSVCTAMLLGDEPIGFLGMTIRDRAEFSESELAFFQALAQQATLAIQLTRLAEEAKQAAIFEERNRMAGEIHDTLAQAFTGISIQLEVAKPLIHRDPQEAQQILDHLSQLAETGLTEARRSVWALYPPAAEYADLAQLLYDSVEQMTRNTDIVIEVNLQGNPCPLPPFIGMNLLRIGQEALTNALKHAQAQTITIELAYESDRVFLTIRDNGRGFIPPTTIDSLNGGFGLMGMYERCDRIGAQLSLTSQPGQGTQILVEVPHERP